jgi:hypothetical protein
MMKYLLMVFLCFFCLIVFIGFISSCGPGRGYQKGVVKEFPDQLIEKQNTWWGGPIGAALSAPIDGTIQTVSKQASREAGQEGKPVAYLSLDGFQRVESFPVGKAKAKTCFLVREQVFQEGKLIRDEVKEICP